MILSCFVVVVNMCEFYIIGSWDDLRVEKVDNFVVCVVVVVGVVSGVSVV